MDHAQSLPTLTIAEAEAIVDELEQAQESHRVWFHSFQSRLVCRSQQRPADMAENAEQRCSFGAWYYRQVSPLLRQHPDFAGLGTLHREMHDAARALAMAAEHDTEVTPEQFDSFTDRVDRFNRGLRKLLDETRDFLRHTDPLTGVGTRFVMLHRLEQERHRITRTGQPCSVGMMDLDRFKDINDTHGHQAGDRVLQDVAQYLLNNLRHYDQFFRYGGEEFVLLLPDTAPEKAKSVLDRLRRGLSRQRIRLSDGTELGISASFGIATLKPDLPVQTTIDRADRAMYEAKRAGRNRVHIWTGDAIAAKRKAGRAPRGAVAERNRGAAPPTAQEKHVPRGAV